MLKMVAKENDKFTGSHPPLHDLTFASKTRKFDSGILKALNEFWSPEPSRDKPKAGKT